MKTLWIHGEKVYLITKQTKFWENLELQNLHWLYVTRKRGP